MTNQREQLVNVNEYMQYCTNKFYFDSINFVDNGLRGGVPSLTTVFENKQKILRAKRGLPDRIFLPESYTAPLYRSGMKYIPVFNSLAVDSRIYQQIPLPLVGGSKFSFRKGGVHRG